MKTIESSTIELSKEELVAASGGIVFELGLIGGMAVGALCMGILIIPIAAAAYKGWNDYK